MKEKKRKEPTTGSTSQRCPGPEGMLSCPVWHVHPKSAQKSKFAVGLTSHGVSQSRAPALGLKSNSLSGSWGFSQPHRSDLHYVHHDPAMHGHCVSNWGGYALACSLYILNSCEVHGRYLRKTAGPSRAPGEQNWAQALPSVAKEEKMLGILVQHKVRSGVSGNVGMEVDGLPFHGTHAQMIQKLVDVTMMCV
ncbi:hypothetical protein MC885_002863 [Smutsia gigantea]|nr:hypothetical protein MC885_002863 [Smutsia gigantea]